MHKHTGSDTKSPEWNRAEGIIRTSRSRYAIACANIMQSEIAERVDDFAAELSGYGEGTVVNGRSCRKRYECPCVAHRAADLIEQS